MKIPERQDFIDVLTRKHLNDPEPEPNYNGDHANGHAPDLSDEEIITMCRKAKNATKFASLYDDGDISGYDHDDSRADMALASLLAFYTDDAAQLERLIGSSALGRREKWIRRDDYRRRTMERALSDYSRERYRYRHPHRGGDAVTADQPGQEAEAKGVRIASVDFADTKEPGTRESILDPTIPKGWPSILFGGAGVAKTIMALSLGQALVNADVENWIAWPVATCGVVYLDLELNADEQARRAYRIARGNGLDRPPKGVRYMSTFGVPRRKRGNVMKRAREECSEQNAEVLVVDSLGLALRGDPGDPTDIIAWFEDELAEFAGDGITVVMIDHQRRLQAGERNQSLGVFGSVYKENLARSMVQVELVRRDREKHSIISRLRPKKANFDELATPVDVRTVFEEDRIHIYKQDLEDEHRASEETLNAKERVLAAVIALGEADPDEITEACGTLSKSTVKKELTNLRNAGKIEDTGNHSPTGASKVRAATGEKRVVGEY